VIQGADRNVFLLGPPPTSVTMQGTIRSLNWCTHLDLSSLATISGSQYRQARCYIYNSAAKVIRKYWGEP